MTRVTTTNQTDQDWHRETDADALKTETELEAGAIWVWPRSCGSLSISAYLRTSTVHLSKSQFRDSKILPSSKFVQGIWPASSVWVPPCVVSSPLELPEGFSLGSEKPCLFHFVLCAQFLHLGLFAIVNLPKNWQQARQVRRARIWTAGCLTDETRWNRVTDGSVLECYFLALAVSWRPSGEVRKEKEKRRLGHLGHLCPSRQIISKI